LPPRYRCPLDRLPASRLLLPRSGLERSDFVRWHIAAPDVCDGTSAVGESRHRIPGASVGQPTEPCLDIAMGALVSDPRGDGNQLARGYRLRQRQSPSQRAAAAHVASRGLGIRTSRHTSPRVAREGNPPFFKPVNLNFFRAERQDPGRGCGARRSCRTSLPLNSIVAVDRAATADAVDLNVGFSE
jgi:hypothetical protein